MTTPTPTPSPTSSVAPPASTSLGSPPAASEGYLAATVGGLVGAVLLTSLGLAAGVALMEIYEDPNGGLANIGLLIYPLALGVLGLLAGLAAGVRIALGWIGAADATRTAWLTMPIAILCLCLAIAGGLGLLGLPAVPVLARRMVLRTRSDAAR